MRLLISAVVVLMLATGCEDKTVEPAGPAPDEYTGLYIYTVQESEEFIQPVEFTIGSSTWMMLFDADAGVDREFCDCRGSYTLTSGMDLVLTDSNLYHDVCNPDRNPFGTFSLDNSTDTLKLIQETSGITKTLKLTRAEQ